MSKYWIGYLVESVFNSIQFNSIIMAFYNKIKEEIEGEGGKRVYLKANPSI